MENSNCNCMITLTIFSEDKEFITYMATNYILDIMKMLGYKVNRVSSGKHIEANQPHWHIMYDVNTQNGKIYKTLNQTLIRKAIDLEFPTKRIADLFRDSEIKISFIYEGQEKKNKKRVFVYGKSYMRYVYKEYNSIDQVDMDLQYGLTSDEIEILRKQGHSEWLILKDKQQREIANQIAEKDEYKSFSAYLEQYLSMHKNSDNSEQLIHRAMVCIWQFKKMQYDLGRCKSIRVSSVKDQAVSWLVFNHYISEEEIVSMTLKNN